jgi:hypothetical protein
MENLAHENEEGVMKKVTIRAALAMFCAAMLLFAAEAARAASPTETGTPPSDAKPDSATQQAGPARPAARYG